VAKCGSLSATVATRLTGGEAMKGVNPVELFVNRVIPTTNKVMTGASHCHGICLNPATTASPAIASVADGKEFAWAGKRRALSFAEGARGIQERNWFSN
jgi:hypothetical protein